jgi:hypothetical protein
MKISELLGAVRAINEAKQRDAKIPPTKKSASRLKSAPSINDAPGDVDNTDTTDDTDDTDNTDEGSATEFKNSAKSIGNDLYVMTAWQYPDAWASGGSEANDLALHTINNLADALGPDRADVSSYNDLNGRYVQNHRSIDLVVYNAATDSMFQISGSGVDGPNSWEVIPDVASMTGAGLLKPGQARSLDVIKRAFENWSNSLPGDIDTRGRELMPDRYNSRDAAWRKAEEKLVKMVGVDLPGYDDGGDPGDPDFWRGVDTNPPVSPEAQKASDDHKQKVLQKMLARKAEMAKKDSAPRAKRK